MTIRPKTCAECGIDVPLNDRAVKRGHGNIGGWIYMHRDCAVRRTERNLAALERAFRPSPKKPTTTDHARAREGEQG